MYFKIIMFYTKYCFYSGFVAVTLPVFHIIGSLIISGDLNIQLMGAKLEPFSSQGFNIILYICHYCCALYFCTYPVLDSLMMMSAVHLISRFKQICKDLDELKTETSKIVFFKKFVERHEQILRSDYY